VFTVDHRDVKYWLELTPGVGFGHGMERDNLRRLAFQGTGRIANDSKTTLDWFYNDGSRTHKDALPNDDAFAYYRGCADPSFFSDRNTAGQMSAGRDMDTVF
jgi:hypothetical protein